MSQQISEQHLVMALAYALACKYIADGTETRPAFWITKFGSQAIEMLQDPEVSRDEIERLCAEALKFDWEG